MGSKANMGKYCLWSQISSDMAKKKKEEEEGVSLEVDSIGEGGLDGRENGCNHHFAAAYAKWWRFQGMFYATWGT